MSAKPTDTYDLAVIGGGINGTGIARDAAGRGLKVLLAEKDDLAAHTSSQSTKLIHGGLRYLEHYEFRLVAEALSEREVLLRVAPHIIHPLQFVLPHEPHLRPAWMIRAGLFLYDHIGGRRTLPSSFGVELERGKWGAGLQRRFRRGFVYSDASVDDSRLVVANAIGARELGAVIRTRTHLVAARREAGLWRATLADSDGRRDEIAARALVNAAGPWVKDVQDDVSAGAIRAAVRHIKGSHIVVPRVHAEPHAYILQNSDKRIVFVIPYHERFSLIGTTDIPVDDYDAPRISPDEVEYLISIANAYLARPIAKRDIVWTYSGVRPLYDDGATDPSAITRDYVLKLDAGDGRAPLLSIFGGKITTYRRLAEHALEHLRPFFREMRPPWTDRQALPGGELPPGGLPALERELARRYSALPARLLAALARRHGSRTERVLGKSRVPADLGTHFGASLYAAEVDYLVTEEWARDAEDVLWRRTKYGLELTGAQCAAVASHLDSSRVSA
ncbi:MAG TPA: glycerol-3-phosphate dehydrogenase [Casimicrobiaceae bacterium]|nr:glycerol-3-phosphate dehydrogenase [Casimicrobiaceae bacterium]